MGVAESHTARHLFASSGLRQRTPRKPAGWLELRGITRNNLQGLDARIPLGVFDWKPTRQPHIKKGAVAQQRRRRDRG